MCVSVYMCVGVCVCEFCVCVSLYVYEFVFPLLTISRS
jgi:hypothetical protein